MGIYITPDSYFYALANNFNLSRTGRTSSTGVAYDLISEGPIELVGGLSGVYFNRTPIVNESLSAQTEAKSVSLELTGNGPYTVIARGNIAVSGPLPIVVLEGYKEAVVTSHTSNTVTVSEFFDSTMVNGTGDNGVLRPKLRIQNSDGSEYVGSILSLSPSVNPTTATVFPPIPGNVVGNRISFDHVTTGTVQPSIWVYGLLYSTSIVLNSLPNATALKSRNNSVVRVTIDSLSSNLPGSSSDNKNFKYAQVNFRSGTQSQLPVENLPSFTSASLGFTKNTEIKQHTDYFGYPTKLTAYWGKNTLRFPKDSSTTGGPVVRILSSEVSPGSENEVDELLLTITTPNGLYGLDNEGDTYSWGVTFQIWFEYQRLDQPVQKVLAFGPTDAEIAAATTLVSSSNATFTKNGADTTGTIRASSKTSMDFDFRWSIEQYKPFVNFAVEVKKVTPDALDYNEVDTITANTTVKALQAFINDKLSYPNSAYAAIAFDSLEFAGNFPERAYRCRGVRTDLPTNYVTREESVNGIANYNRLNGVDTGTYEIWDGTFRRGYSNNPIWNLREMLLNKRWGLGHWVDESLINNYSFYSLARYCDELVPDGNGGLEPRFTCGVYLTQPVEAYKIIRDFCSMVLSIPYWIDGQMIIEGDRPAEPVYTFTKGNIDGGIFSYEGTGNKTRPNQIAVRFNNKDNFYEQDLELVDDVEDMVKQNRIFTEEVTAFGATTRGQAVRYGKWKLLTSKLQKEVVSFKTGENAVYLRPGSVINIQDADRNSVRYSGRVVSATNSTVTLDSGVSSIILGPDGLGRVSEYTLHVFIPGSAVYLVQDTATLSAGTFNRGDRLPLSISTEKEASEITDTAGNPVYVQFVEDAHIESLIINSVNVVNGVTTVGVLGTFTSAPSAETVWAITQKIQASLVAGSTKQYKILSIAEESPGLYSITAAEHFNSKFDLIDENFIATSPRTVSRYDELPPIVNFTGKIVTSRGTSDSLSNTPNRNIRLDWEGPFSYVNNVSALDPRVDSFILEIVNPLGETTINTLRRSESTYTLLNVQEGRYSFTLRAKSSQGPSSAPSRLNMAVEFVSTKNSNVVGSLPMGGRFNKPLNVGASAIIAPSSYRFTAESGVSVIYSENAPIVTPGTYWSNGSGVFLWDGENWTTISGIFPNGVNATLAPFTLSATGSIAGAITGSLSSTLGAVTVSGTGSVSGAITGSLSSTLGAVTVSGTGSVSGAITGSLSSTLGNVTVSGTGSTGSSYETESEALFARMTAQPDATRKGHINTLIASLKSAGVWSKLDTLYLFAAHDSQAGLLNWKSTSFNATLVGPNLPAHNTDIGFSGATAASSTASHLTAGGYDPSVGGLNYVAASSHFGIFTTKIATFNDIMRVRSGGFNAGFIRAEGRVFGRSGFNTQFDILPGSVAQRGHYVLNRETTTDGAYYNGTAAAATSTADTEIRGPFNLLVGGGLNGHRIATHHAGAHLTSTEAADLYAALNTYLTALGT